MVSGVDKLSMLRVSTAGSVDDGKSTLIGRLLYDSKNLCEDHVAAITKASEKIEGGALSLALVTDGLRAEREQGITIDVAYRYFSTPRRRFILADTPGHEQYTRNMATGASNADVAIVLMDATKGVLTQTRRHAFISSLLGVPRLVVAVNKMDLVGYSQEVFEKIREQFLEFSKRLNFRDIYFIPVSALAGDNIVVPSGAMPWFRGTLLEYLENVYVGADKNHVDFRFPVQYVIRTSGTYRGYAGQIGSGSIKVGEPVVVLPSLRQTRVRSIDKFPEMNLPDAVAPQSVVITLEDEIDISRGDMIVRAGNVPQLLKQVDAMLVWFSEQPLQATRQYILQCGSRPTKVLVSDTRYLIDVTTLSRSAGRPLNLNEIGRCTITSAQPLIVDSYRQNRGTGSFVLIDPETNHTVAAGMYIDSVGAEARRGAPLAAANRNLHTEVSQISAMERHERSGVTPSTVWFTGLPASGKSTVARAFERMLFDAGISVFHLDGDNLRHGLNKDLGFSPEDRRENLRRAAHVAALLNGAGVTALCAFVSPFADDRAMVREIVGADRFVEVHVSTPRDVCAARDPHGLYAKAQRGELKGLTGVDSPYEVPVAPDLVLSCEGGNIAESLSALQQVLISRGLLSAELPRRMRPSGLASQIQVESTESAATWSTDQLETEELRVRE
jgi:bifunctional enzyme CysN/CysC